MRTLFAVSALTSASVCRADAPAPAVAMAAPACRVRVLQAPAHVAGELEGRLAALSACDARLDVWVVRAEAGLFVTARDAGGRVRTRLVPDVQVAAALVASWVEMVAVETSRGAAAPAAPAAGADPPRRDADDWMLDSGAVPARARVTPPVARTVAITGFAGATTSGMTTAGGTIDLDLSHHDGLSLAALVVVNRDATRDPAVGVVTDGFFRETGRWGGAALVRLHRRFGTGRLRITPAIAFGAGIARHSLLTAEVDQLGRVTAFPSDDTTVGLRVAASFALGVRVGRAVDLEVSGGWMLSSYEARAGVDPADHALVAAIGLRHDR